MFRHALITPLFLIACAGADLNPSVTVQATAGQLAYVAPALTQARDNFLGTGGGSGGSGGGSPGGFGLDEPVSIGGAIPTRTAVTLSRQDDLPAGLHLRSSFALSHDALGATLPQGLGVLTDPITAQIWADMVTAEVTLGRSTPLGRSGVLDLAAGLGLQHGLARAHLQSALIDLTSQVVVTDPYVILRGQYGWGRSLTLMGEALVMDRARTEYRLGIAQSF